MDRMQHVPVDREAPAAAYLAARRLLREGEAVGVFPEAGISWSYTVRSLMRGVASLARETGRPGGAGRDLGARSGSGRSASRTSGAGAAAEPARADVASTSSFGAPLTIGAGDDLTEWTRRLGALLTDQLEALQRLPHHVPRAGRAALRGTPPTSAGTHRRAREAAHLDVVPRSAVSPTWGPGLAGRRRVRRRERRFSRARPGW